MEFNPLRKNTLGALAITLSGTSVLCFFALSGTRLSLVGVSLGAGSSRALAAALSLLSAVIFVGVVRRLIKGLPAVSFRALELVASGLFMQKRVAWTDISAISPPSTIKFGFRSTMTFVVVRRNDGGRLRLTPPYREASPQEFYELLLEWWMRNTGVSHGERG